MNTEQPPFFLSRELICGFILGAVFAGLVVCFGAATFSRAQSCGLKKRAKAVHVQPSQQANYAALAQQQFLSADYSHALQIVQQYYKDGGAASVTLDKIAFSSALSMNDCVMAAKFVSGSSLARFESKCR